MSVLFGLTKALITEKGNTNMDKTKDKTNAKPPATIANPIPIKKKRIFAPIRNSSPSKSREKITPGILTKPKLVTSQKNELIKLFFIVKVKKKANTL
jgi:hypothetical protein